MAESKKMQPLALARALVVARKKCREQEQLIRTLTQNINLKEIAKLPEACKWYDRPCLQDFLAKQTPMSKQVSGENSQSFSTPPPVASKENSQHQIEIPAQVGNVPKRDLSGWEITCTKFRPRKRRPGKGAPAPPPGQQTQHSCFNCGHMGHFLPNCPLPRRLPPVHKQCPTRANRKKKGARNKERVNHLQIPEATARADPIPPSATESVKKKHPCFNCGKKRAPCPWVPPTMTSQSSAANHSSTRWRQYQPSTRGYPLKEYYVGVIKSARHPGVKFDHGFPSFSLTPIA